MVTITHVQDDSAQAQGNVITIERLMRVEADDLMEVVSSSKIPQYQSRHPKNSLFKVTAKNFTVVGNLNRKSQFNVSITYTNEEAVNEQNKDPWDLDAQNVHVSYSTENIPLVKGYNRNGERIDIVNTAGGRLQVETQQVIRQISFIYCVKAGRSGEAPVNNRALINSSQLKVAGYKFAPFEAMLMPMNANFIVDVDDQGEIYRRYWQIEAVIMENPQTWERQALNVGTMAIPTSGNARIPKPIYQYTPWKNTDIIENLREEAQFGGIDDVIAAKLAYANLFASAERQSRFDELPYSEITEPMPLNRSGNLYIDAIKNPQYYKYLTVDFFETRPQSWSKYNLPSERM